MKCVTIPSFNAFQFNLSEKNHFNEVANARTYMALADLTSGYAP